MNQSTRLHLRALRVAFFGTTDFAAFYLYTLLFCSIHKIIVIFTQEKSTSTKKSSFPSMLKIAKAYKLNLFISRYLLQSDMIQILIKLQIDIIIVVSYGLILPKTILDIPKFGCINIHGSLLPRWRGAAPIQRSIEHGDLFTGISIIQMNLKIDTGNILYTKTCKILPTDTSYSLSKKLAKIGSIGLLQTIEKIMTYTCPTIPQNSLHATYAHKINKQEARIDWKSSAIELDRRIRAFNPWPISYFYTHKQRIRVWTAHFDENLTKVYNLSTFYPGTILKANSSGIYVNTGSGLLILTILQIPGKQKKPVKDILNAYYKWFIPHSILE